MATWDIVVPAGSGVGNGSSAADAVSPTVPGNFDGATITDVSVVGSPTVISDVPAGTDDTLQIHWNIATSGGVNVYGNNIYSGSFCRAELGDGVASDTITENASATPTPTIAVAADWDVVEMHTFYTANMKNDGETCSWLPFTIRVTYTPLPADIQQDHYRFCGEPGSAIEVVDASTDHETWTLNGTVDTSREFALDDTVALIIKLGNDGTGAASSASWQLEYNNDADPGWNNVNASSTYVRPIDSGDTDNAFSTTERLTTTSRTFFTSRLDDVNGSAASNINADNDVEFYYAFQFRSADLSGSETITFRITNLTETVTYNVTPTATIAAAAAVFLPFYPNKQNTLLRM